MKTITQILIASILFFAPLTLKSTHIVGGTFKYEVLKVINDFATVEVTLYMYRDDNGGAQFDQNIQLGLYRYANSDYDFLSLNNVQLSSSNSIVLDPIPFCPGQGIIYEMGIYISQFEIPLKNFEHFTIAHQRCCMDNSITNINYPEGTGIAISFDLYPKAFEIINQPIDMNHNLPIMNGIGETNTYDLSVNDGFDREYYLSTPKAGGGISGISYGDPQACDGITPNAANCPPEYPEVIYSDEDNPYGIETSIEIGSESGVITIESTEINKILVGLTLDKYLDDELFCRIRQQFLVNNLDCGTSATMDNLELEVKIWPVPSTGKLSFDNQLQNISILNTHGALQHFQSRNKFADQVDLNHLADGIYILKAQTAEGKWIAKKIVLMD